MAAAVILQCDPMPGVNDSKQLSGAERGTLSRLILSKACAVAIGVVESHVIDRINILNASKLAMRYAIDDLEVRPDVLVLDAVEIESLEMPQVPLIGGDRRSVSVAAASIVAKYYRDLLMESYHQIYPQYDFVNNRGYGTDDHRRALQQHGPCPIHRRSFEGVSEPWLLFEQTQTDGIAAR